MSNTIQSNKSLGSASQELWHTVEKEPTLNLRSASQELWHSVKDAILRSRSQEFLNTEVKEPTPNLEPTHNLRSASQ